jgi:ribokinase
VVAGGINMDLVVRTSRLPRPGETVHGRDLTAVPGGKGANQAVAVARLGGATRLLGMLGDDDYGRRLRQGLTEAGVEARWVGTVPGQPSGVALIAVADGGENSIIVAPGANGLADGATVRRAADAFAGARLVVGNLEWPAEAVAALLECAEPGALRLLNAAPAYRETLALLPAVDWLVVNEHEAQALAEVAVKDVDTAREAGERLRLLGVGNVVVTLGAAGAVLTGPDGALHQPAPDVSVVDTTAAGDAFTGALTVALAEEMVPAAALRFAVAAGSLACTVLGAQPSLPSRERVERMLPGLPVGVRL